MKVLNALNIINDLASSQRGFFTSAQAKEHGVARITLSRLTQHDQIERFGRGTYRACAAPSFREERVYADWLSLDPCIMAYDRAEAGTEYVASHGTAAWLHHMGEINPEPITFSCSKRRQTKRAGLRLVRKDTAACDIVLANGIPATTPSRTILDLLDDREDLSLVASCLLDATALDKRTQTEEFRRAVNTRNAKYGLPRDADLYSLLTKGGSDDLPHSRSRRPRN